MDLTALKLPDFRASLPVFVRKVDRAGHWNEPEDILKNVFAVDDDGTISIWLVESVKDLALVSLAMNANKVATNPKGASLVEPVRLVAIQGSELDEIQLDQTAGVTDCGYAKNKHYNAIPPTEESVKRLVDRLLGVGRLPAKVSEGFLKAAKREAEKYMCHSVMLNGDKCGCE